MRTAHPEISGNLEYRFRKDYSRKKQRQCSQAQERVGDKVNSACDVRKSDEDPPERAARIARTECGNRLALHRQKSAANRQALLPLNPQFRAPKSPILKKHEHQSRGNEPATRFLDEHPSTT